MRFEFLRNGKRTVYNLELHEVEIGLCQGTFASVFEVGLFELCKHS